MIKTELISVRHIISEPGDGTHYDYIIANDGTDNFVFAPMESTFRFPQRINYWEAREAAGNYDELAQKEGCNPFTYAECAKTAMAIREGRI